MTDNYYNQNASAFINDTFKCDMSVQYDFFERNLLNKNCTVLDLGFGSGRDSLYFMKKGYTVYAMDPSEEFCNNAKNLGITNVSCTLAQEMEYIDLFDGIWACASLLHVPSDELNAVFKKCSTALKDTGIMYVSFKYGEFEGERAGRRFLDLNEESLKKYLLNTGLKIKEVLITEDVRPDKTTKWLNAILIKN